MRAIIGIGGILCGIVIIVLAIVDIEPPKLLWLVFALYNFINTLLILRYSNLWNKSKK